MGFFGACTRWEGTLGLVLALVAPPPSPTLVLAQWSSLHALLDGPGMWKAPLSLLGGRTVQIGSAQLGRQKDTDGDESWAWRNSNRGWRAHLSEAGLPCHAARASQ